MRTATSLPASPAPAAARSRPMDGIDPIACFVLGTMLLLIVFGPGLAPYSITAFQPEHALQPPSLAFPFGTDEFGRDLFSRVLAGARPTLLLALASAGAGVVLGAVTGLIAGYFPGPLDETMMRVMDALMSFPGLILAMLVVVMLGNAPINVIIAIAVVFWPRSARLVRSVVVGVARHEFVEAARSRGEGHLYIIFREILPNVWPLIVVDFSLRVTAGILLSASLAYLGIGVTPPTPAWGLLVRDAQPFLQFAPWLVVFPCIAVAVLSVMAVVAGERLRRVVALPGGSHLQGGRR